MDVITRKLSLISLTERLRDEWKTIGFVPTMGALHAGHLSLVKKSKEENDITIASVFVNPTQFNDKDDLENYPRSPERDVALLKECGCDYAFLPGMEEIYPDEDTRTFSFGYAGSVMEGERRPGHFNGVAQVVSRLFDIVSPDRAYFGQKDFQQVVIIRQLVQQSRYNVKIVVCPTVRETDGLAMSSRNALLSTDQRASAPRIYQTLKRAAEMTASTGVQELKAWVTREIDESPYLKTDYFEIVDSVELRPVQSWQEAGEKIGCVAVHAGKVRLIDNIIIA
jgi:pantoate--beta-alanine ligase